MGKVRPVALATARLGGEVGIYVPVAKLHRALKENIQMGAISADGVICRYSYRGIRNIYTFEQ
jgi:hypothetical protein